MNIRIVYLLVQIVLAIQLYFYSHFISQVVAKVYGLRRTYYWSRRVSQVNKIESVYFTIIILLKSQYRNLIPIMNDTWKILRTSLTLGKIYCDFDMKKHHSDRNNMVNVVVLRSMIDSGVFISIIFFKHFFLQKWMYSNRQDSDNKTKEKIVRKMFRDYIRLLVLSFILLQFLPISSLIFVLFFMLYFYMARVVFDQKCETAEFLLVGNYIRPGFVKSAFNNLPIIFYLAQVS